MHRARRVGASWLALATLALLARSVFPCEHVPLDRTDPVSALIAAAMCLPIATNPIDDTAPLGSRAPGSPDAGIGACHATCDNACAANRVGFSVSYYTIFAFVEPAFGDQFRSDSARWAVVQPRAPPVLMPRSV